MTLLIKSSDIVLLPVKNPESYISRFGAWTLRRAQGKELVFGYSANFPLE
jgi:hypothetical protein